MQRSRCFAVALALTVLAGCSSPGRLEQSERLTRVDLTQKNYRVLRANAVGDDWGWRLFCVLPFAHITHAAAKAKLYEGVPIEGKATGLVNMTEDKTSTCWIFFSYDKLILSADIVEFTGPEH